MIRSLGEKVPNISENVFIAENAAVLGAVTLYPGSSVWYGAVVRGDLDTITIGEGSNIQDNVTLHSDRGAPISIGKGVSIGHNAVVHGATIGDNTLVGMNSTVLNGAIIGKNCIIGAGAMVAAGAHFADNSLIVGCPAQAISELHPVQIAGNEKNADTYRELAKLHRQQ